MTDEGVIICFGGSVNETTKLNDVVELTPDSHFAKVKTFEDPPCPRDF